MSDSTTPRRDFLAQIATAGLATAGLSLANAAVTTAAGLPIVPVPDDAGAAPRFDDSWTARVKAARHKAVFDAPTIEDGMAVWQAALFRRGYQDALGAAEAAAAVPVIVLRHAATVLVIDDALWEKYKLGEMRKVDDPITKKPAIRNPYARPRADAPPPSARHKAIFGNDPEPTLEGAMKGGAIVLGCNVALGQMIERIATQAGTTPEATRAEVLANLVPGVVMQPSGVYATLRAQEVGCVFMRSTTPA